MKTKSIRFKVVKDIIFAHQLRLDVSLSTLSTRYVYVRSFVHCWFLYDINYEPTNGQTVRLGAIFTAIFFKICAIMTKITVTESRRKKIPIIICFAIHTDPSHHKTLSRLTFLTFLFRLMYLLIVRGRYLCSGYSTIHLHNNDGLGFRFLTRIFVRRLRKFAMWIDFNSNCMARFFSSLKPKRFTSTGGRLDFNATAQLVNFLHHEN